MKLYELRFNHYAPRGHRSGIEGYLLAENDYIVFDYLKNTSYAFYAYDEEGGELDKDSLGYKMYRDRIVYNKGSMYVEETIDELSDLYYGDTLHGWKVVKDVNSFQGLYAKLSAYGINIEGAFYKEDGSLGLLSAELDNETK